jgi:hypothetical protein
MGRRQGGPSDWHCQEAYLNRYVTEEQRGRRPIFIATLRAARILAGPADAGSFIGQAVAGPLRVFSLFASLSQPNFALVPVRLGPLLYQAQTWCTREALFACALGNTPTCG